MVRPNDDSIIIHKARELCQAILEQPQFSVLRKQVDCFMADSNAQGQYQLVAQSSDLLQQRQRSGQPISGEEISQFERDREALLNNPVARGFLEAQEAFQQVHSSVNEYVAKTLELGRLPNPEDFEGSCGHGCGCHH